MLDERMQKAQQLEISFADWMHTTGLWVTRVRGSTHKTMQLIRTLGFEHKSSSVDVDGSQWHVYWTDAWTAPWEDGETKDVPKAD
eukprot:3170127-Amphidinium_carterae.1